MTRDPVDGFELLWKRSICQRDFCMHVFLAHGFIVLTGLSPQNSLEIQAFCHDVSAYEVLDDSCKGHRTQANDQNKSYVDCKCVSGIDQKVRFCIKKCEEHLDDYHIEHIKSDCPHYFMRAEELTDADKKEHLYRIGEYGYNAYKYE